MRCEFIKDGRVAKCKRCGHKRLLSQCPDDVAEISRWCDPVKELKLKAQRQHGRPTSRGEEAYTTREQLKGYTVEDFKKWSKAVGGWAASGFKTRSDAEVSNILENICKPCSKYNNGRCLVCRCNINSGAAMFNKIRMGTQKCPLGKW